MASAPDTATLPHAQKFEQLLACFRPLPRVIVAYSGGVDSTLLVKAGTMAIGERCLAVIARSETLTDDEFDKAMAVAAEHGFNVKAISYSELAIPNYAENPVNRCYFCKHELYTQLTALAGELKIPTIIEGSNASDVGDWRPGMKAVAELSVLSPLREANLHKDEIRELARSLGLPNWDKPSNPCLSSRIAYGQKIDRQKLEQVAKGEAFLRERGFRQVRVRHLGDAARVEVATEELARLFEPDTSEAVTQYLLSLGFPHVNLDPSGYRTGRLNEGVTRPASVPTI
jgi:pyridinium-3,5-biscarboxylic acid mononucleotide sulfurtransferase